MVYRVSIEIGYPQQVDNGEDYNSLTELSFEMDKPSSSFSYILETQGIRKRTKVGKCLFSKYIVATTTVCKLEYCQHY